MYGFIPKIFRCFIEYLFLYALWAAVLGRFLLGELVHLCIRLFREVLDIEKSHLVCYLELALRSYKYILIILFFLCFKFFRYFLEDNLIQILGFIVIAFLNDLIRERHLVKLIYIDQLCKCQAKISFKDGKEKMEAMSQIYKFSIKLDLHHLFLLFKSVH